MVITYTLLLKRLKIINTHHFTQGKTLEFSIKYTLPIATTELWYSFIRYKGIATTEP